MEKIIQPKAKYRLLKEMAPYTVGMLFETNEYGNCSNVSQFAGPILQAFLDDGRIELVVEEPTNGEKYVQDAMRAGFTRGQAVWLHNEFYDVKAI